jgi:hypothetical protein
MKNKFCKLLLWVTFVNISFVVSAAVSQFVVQDQVQASKYSKNSLKQEIGTKLKESLHVCTSISKELAEIQKELAEIQSRFLSKIEDLIEDKVVFRKAGKSHLSKSANLALKVACECSQLKDSLVSQKNKIKELDKLIEQDECLKTATKNA